MATATESVLLSLDDPTTLEVLILLFHRKVDVGVDHVLELVRSSHLPILGHLSDDENVHCVDLRVVSQHAHRSLRRCGGDATGLEVTVIHALQRVDDKEEWTIWMICTNPVAALEKSLDVVLVADHELVAQTESISSHLDLVDTLLSGVEHDLVSATLQ